MTTRDVVIAEARLTVLAWLGESIDGGKALRESLVRLAAVVSELDDVEQPKRASAPRRGYFEVVNVHGETEGPLTRALAQEYAKLWDRDYPADAPHEVRKRVRRSGST